MTRLSSLLLPALLLGSLAAPATAQGTGSDRLVRLRYAEFDPAVTQPVLPPRLAGGKDTRLWIVQFEGRPTEARRAALRDAGAEVHGYLPENAYVVRMSQGVRGRVVTQRGVRSASYYHPAFRLEPQLVADLAKGVHGPAAAVASEYHVVVVDKHADKPVLARALARLGGKVTHERRGSLLMQVALTRGQLLGAARLDQVLWIERVTAVELDMDNARKQGGADFVEAQGGYTGKGIHGHVFEGVEATHRDFDTMPSNILSTGAAASHGHCTAGIIFGNGKSNSGARGMAPDAKASYTTHTAMTGSRWQVIEAVAKAEGMFTTASWGNAKTTFYTAISAEVDDIVFDHDMPWTQSQSNSSSTPSRPEAWAKNLFSIGAVAHGDNANPADDSWRRGGGSTGPAVDGRIKPDLVAYDDSILCSDLTGLNGYNRNGDFYARFGGTSGATAICAGHNAIAIQMFTDGLFSPKRKANGTRWENRPHFTTLKALQIANASQYAFTKASTDNRREHVGWGFPSLKTMYDRRAVHYVVDETDVLKQGDGMLYRINVAQGQPELKVSLCFADPAGNPAAARARVNDLSLRVVAPNGTNYFGNVGLSDGNYSAAGGVRNIVDTVENVFIKNPAAGVWQIEVGAFLVAEDSHRETTVVDADFGLVAVGGKFVSKTKIDVPVGAFVTFGAGCPSGPGCVPFAVRNWTRDSANKTTTAQRVAMMDWTDDVTNVCKLELYMGARSGAVDVNVGIYDMDGASALPGKALFVQKTRVTALRTYSLSLPAPIELEDGQIFFVVLDNADKLVLPISSTGKEKRLHYEMRSNRWGTNLFQDTLWQYRLEGVLGDTVPTLTGSGEATLGRTFRFELTNAGATRPAVMLLGASDKKWGPINLPLRYAVLCDLLVSGDLLLPFLTNSSGGFTVPLPIPNDKGLVSTVTFQQFLVSDVKNPLGWIVSNGGRLKIGE